MPLAHVGRPLAPHELWAAWNPDPLVLAGLALLGWVYWRGLSPGTPRWQAWSFLTALLVLAAALLSPLDTLSGVLASAHMVQHLLLTLVAAPLLALSAPAGPLLRGAPAALRQAVSPSRRRLGPLLRASDALRNPALVWLLHVATLWAWHSAVLYDAALANPLLHALEHATFLLTGLLLWRVVVGARAVRASPGVAVLLLFGTTLQSALLALLLTFARTPWYVGYTTTTRSWGLEQLADQHLAGAIMWVPAGFVYLGVAVTLLVGWVRGTQGQEDLPTVAGVPPAPIRVGGRA